MFISSSVQATHSVCIWVVDISVFELGFTFLVRFIVFYTPLCLPFRQLTDTVLGETSWVLLFTFIFARSTQPKMTGIR